MKKDILAYLPKRSDIMSMLPSRRKPAPNDAQPVALPVQGVLPFDVEGMTEDQIETARAVAIEMYDEFIRRHSLPIDPDFAVDDWAARFSVEGDITPVEEDWDIAPAQAAESETTPERKLARYMLNATLRHIRERMVVRLEDDTPPPPPPPGGESITVKRGSESNLAELHQYSRDVVNNIFAEFARQRRDYSQGTHPSLLLRETPRTPQRANRPLPQTLHFPSNTVHAAALRALSGATAWEPLPGDGMAMGTTLEYKQLQITVGLPDGTNAESVWEYLAKSGPLSVKAHYALWARWYDQTGGDNGAQAYITVDIAQFCQDLGYKLHHKGGYRLQNKQRAVAILEAMTAIELRATYTLPGGKNSGRAQRLRGPLWAKGIIAEETQRGGDLWGDPEAEPRPQNWEPTAFSFAPGPWFANNEWRRYNKAIGKIGAGILQLSNESDQWAILIGGYLGTILRTNQYRPLRLRVRTILSRTNLAQGADSERRVSQIREKFEAALDRLREVDVIEDWTYPDVDTTDIEDMDDIDEIDAYYHAAENKAKRAPNWRDQCIAITVNRAEDAARLAAAQARARAPQTAISAARRLSAKPADTP